MADASPTVPELEARTAPDCCPVCLSRLYVKHCKVLASGIKRRYRQCRQGCYTDAVDVCLRVVRQSYDPAPPLPVKRKRRRW